MSVLRVNCGAIFLVGMMGSGKSTIGRLLASQTDRKHMDTDKELERRLGSPIPRLFKAYGEAAFRDHETAVLRTLDVSECIVSTGGGIVLREVNWTLMRERGATVYLEATWEQLCRRLEASKRRRPLLDREDWKEGLAQILLERESLYRQADHIVTVEDDEPIVVCARVCSTLGWCCDA